MSWGAGAAPDIVAAPVPVSCGTEGETPRAAAPPVLRTSSPTLNDWPLLTCAGAVGRIDVGRGGRERRGRALVASRGGDREQQGRGQLRGAQSGSPRSRRGH